jgi:hypothetical protein
MRGSFVLPRICRDSSAEVTNHGPSNSGKTGDKIKRGVPASSLEVRHLTYQEVMRMTALESESHEPDGRSFYDMRFTESRRGRNYAKPRLVLSRRRGQARGLHANEQSTRASFYRKESTSCWHARIAARFGSRTRPGDSIRICEFS